MLPLHTRSVVPYALALSLMAWSGPSAAHGAYAGAAPKVAELPPGEVKSALEKLESEVREGGVEPALVERPKKEAARAVERATGALAASDRFHGRLLEKLALEWARLGRSLVRAVRLERRGHDEAERARELTAKLDRARALLAEQQARRGRLEEQVRAAEVAARAAAEAAAEKERQRLQQAEKKPRRRGAP